MVNMMKCDFCDVLKMHFLPKKSTKSSRFMIVLYKLICYYQDRADDCIAG